MRRADLIAGWIVVGLGFLHLLAGHAAFLSPTEPRIWFASAGLLLIVTGLANRATAGEPSRLMQAAALAGNLSILLIGVLLMVASPALRAQPQTWVLLGMGAFLSIRRARDMASTPG